MIPSIDLYYMRNAPRFHLYGYDEEKEKSAPCINLIDPYQPSVQNKPARSILLSNTRQCDIYPSWLYYKSTRSGSLFNAASIMSRLIVISDIVRHVSPFRSVTYTHLLNLRLSLTYHQDGVILEVKWWQGQVRKCPPRRRYYGLLYVCLNGWTIYSILAPCLNSLEFTCPLVDQCTK